jgi:hypothetical protein
MTRSLLIIQNGSGTSFTQFLQHNAPIESQGGLCFVLAEDTRLAEMTWIELEQQSSGHT